MTVREIYDAIDRIAPFQTAMNFDNVGILVGDENVDVTKTLLCLDVTPRVLREAKSIGVELIISHHPVIFNPLRTVQPQVGTAKRPRHFKRGRNGHCLHGRAAGRNDNGGLCCAH